MFTFPRAEGGIYIFFSLFYALKENSNYKIKGKVNEITFKPSVHSVHYKMFYWCLKSVSKFPHNWWLKNFLPFKGNPLHPLFFVKWNLAHSTHEAKFIYSHFPEFFLVHYSVSFLCYQKRKRKQSEPNHGEVDSRAFHEKVGGVSFAWLKAYAMCLDRELCPQQLNQITNCQGFDEYPGVITTASI